MPEEYELLATGIIYSSKGVTLNYYYDFWNILALLEDITESSSFLLFRVICIFLLLGTLGSNLLMLIED